MDEPEEKMDVDDEEFNDEEESDSSNEVEESENSDTESDSDDEDDEDDDEDSEDSDSDDVEVQEEVTLRVSDLDDHFICIICKGYLRNAQTIVECLHTFCKSCIVKHLCDQKGPKSCPKCSVSLQGDGLSSLRFDSTMQDLVDKIFPILKIEDQKKEDERNRKRNLQHKPEQPSRREEPSRQDSDATKNSTKASNVPSTKKEVAEEKTTTSGKAIQNAQVSFKILPNEDASEELRLSALQKPFLRTPGKLKISHLQKYLASKLEGDVVKDDVQLLCCGEKMKADYTLDLVLHQYWKDSKNDLILNYQRLEKQ